MEIPFRHIIKYLSPDLLNVFTTVIFNTTNTILVTYADGTPIFSPGKNPKET